MTGKRCWRVLLIAVAVLAGASTAWATHNPHLGRFLQRDPKDSGQPRGGYHDGMNLYQYVSSDPIGHVDPMGLWEKDIHWKATFDIAVDIIGFKRKCAKVIADWNQGVDDWTPAWNPFATQFHFNKDINGKECSCGRDCWFKRRWKKGVAKLKKANVYHSLSLFDVSVTDGVAHIGAALHSRQDSFAHIAKHDAETPFDHAPDKVCFLWGDWFGAINQRCIKARHENPNWGNHGRPDDAKRWSDEADAAKTDTENLLRAIWQIPSVQCHCKGDGK
jgi:hypothetical protein